MLNIYYVSKMFSLNIHRLNLFKCEKAKAVLNALIKIVNESNRNPNKL